MRTLQAPVLAAGKHFEVLATLDAMSSPTLLVEPGLRAFPHNDRACVLDEFARARAHLSLCFQLRLSFWVRLPWICFGLAYPVAQTARECAGRALALFAASPDNERHHPLTLRLCSPGTVCHAQMRLFASGQAELRALPSLELEAAKLRFASVSERWVESRHALTQRYVAAGPHIAATHIAYDGIQKPLRHILEHRFAELSELATCCERVRNPMSCLRTMGLLHHLAVVRLVESNPWWKLSRKHHPAIVEILYHVDAFSLHAALPDDDTGARGDSDDANDPAGGDGPVGGGGGGAATFAGPPSGPLDTAWSAGGADDPSGGLGRGFRGAAGGVSILERMNLELAKVAMLLQEREVRRDAGLVVGGRGQCVGAEQGRAGDGMGWERRGGPGWVGQGSAEQGSVCLDSHAGAQSQTVGFKAPRLGTYSAALARLIMRSGWHSDDSGDGPPVAL